MGGVMFWALDLDDFSGTFCDQGKYPLIQQTVDTLHSVSEDSLLGHQL